MLQPARRDTLLLLLLRLLLLLQTLAWCHAASPTKLSLDDAIRNSLQVPTPAPTPAPTAAPMATSAPVTSVTLAPQPTTYKNVTSDMKAVIKAVGQVECPEQVRKNTFAIYKNNRMMFDTCTRESKYQLLPHEEGVPTPAQTAALVTSRACIDLFSGIVLANFPECDIDGFSIRSAVEALFRIRADVLAGRGAPTQRQFDEFYSLNRVVNLLAENATLIETVLARHATRISLSEMARMMNRIDIDPAVSIAANMTISIASTRTTYTGSEPSTTGSAPVVLPSASVLAEGGNSTRTNTPTSGSASRVPALRLVQVAVVLVLCVWRC